MRNEYNKDIAKGLWHTFLNGERVCHSPFLRYKKTNKMKGAVFNERNLNGRGADRFGTKKYPRRFASDLKLSKRTDWFVDEWPVLPTSLLIPQADWAMIINSSINLQVCDLVYAKESSQLSTSSIFIQPLEISGSSVTSVNISKILDFICSYSRLLTR